MKEHSDRVLRSSSNSAHKSSSDRRMPTLTKTFHRTTRMELMTPPKKIISIQVETLLGQNLSVQILSTASVLELKEKIFETQGIPVESQIIIYRENQLNDNSIMIGKLGIQEGSVLKLLVHMAGGPGPPMKTKHATTQDSVLLLLCRQNDELFMLEVHMKDKDKLKATHQLLELTDSASYSLLEGLEQFDFDLTAEESRPNSTSSSLSTSTFLSFLTLEGNHHVKSRPGSSESFVSIKNTKTAVINSSSNVKKSRPATAISIMKKEEKRKRHHKRV